MYVEVTIEYWQQIFMIIVQINAYKRLYDVHFKCYNIYLSLYYIAIISEYVSAQNQFRQVHTTRIRDYYSGDYIRQKKIDSFTLL
jgi:hypothetical protein